jgi:hypothetical protein
MSEKQTEALRQLQKRLEADAARVTTRDDLIRLRMYWGDIQTVLDSEPNGE